MVEDNLPGLENNCNCGRIQLSAAGGFFAQRIYRQYRPLKRVILPSGIVFFRSVEYLRFAEISMLLHGVSERNSYLKPNVG